MALRPSDGARTLADVALAELREAIVSGEIPPGTPIRLQEYVDRLRMSTVPIREALRFLEQKGLIERTPHRGVYVSAMSARDLDDTYRIRLDLESRAVRLAAESMTEADGKRILGLVEDYAKASLAGDPVARDIHGDIHMSLYELSGSKWLLLLLPMLWDNSERYRRLSLPLRGTPEQRIEEHRQIVEACAAGDPDRAEALLRSHLSNSFEAAIAALREEEKDELPAS
ncbi:MAG TPA: GntR family transcriptional regulator [Acidimicrobiia bacterium]|nr:GntR family transcriptional regulator [Acidimicrobiia bacterium]